MREMIRLAVRVAISGLLGVLTLTTQAQNRPLEPIQMFFAMPTAVDPSQLFLFTPGQSYNHTNDSNGITYDPITGNTILPGPGGQDGLEIHGRFGAEGDTPVGEIDFSVSYLGPITLTAITDPLITPDSNVPYDPWLVTDLGIQNGRHGFSMKPQPGSARMSQFDYFGLLTAVAPEGMDTSDFQQADFSFTGLVHASVTPEPASAGLLVVGMASCGLLALRRRKSEASQPSKGMLRP